MIELHRSVHVAREPAAVFALATDPSRFPALYERTARFERISGEGMQVGSVHRLLVHLGGAVVRSVVRVDAHEPPERLSWVRVAGIEQHGEIRVRPEGTGSELSIRVNLALPGGIVGVLAERYFGRLLSPRLEAALLAARRTLEFGDSTA